jgi:NitT/TauT family transport system substrate-binding protein
MRISQSRRAFLAVMSAVGAATVLRSRNTLADEGPPEVTTIRLRHDPDVSINLIGGGVDTLDCNAPELIAKELLIEEGFTDVQYVAVKGGDIYSKAFQDNQVDFGFMSPGGLVKRIEDGVPIKVIAGIHPGCFELFAHEQIKTVEDLKGKQVGVDSITATPGQFVTFIAASAGLDPEKDIRWVTPEGGADLTQLFMDGKIDAYMAFMPHAHGLHERNAGHVLVDLARTEPWSKTFCCLTVGRTGFVQDSPIATKRALRALLKATDLCAQEPQKAAQRLVDSGFTTDYANAYNIISDLNYDAWRTLDSEHSLRFYAGQLQQIGQLKSNPDKVIADGTDFSFLNELKRELKA